MRNDVRRLHSAHDITGVVLATSGAIAFGTVAISAKFAYRVGADPLPLLAARFALAALLLAGYHVATKRSSRVGSKVFLRLTVGGGLLFGFQTALYFIALQRAPAAVVGLVLYSYPLWTVLLGFITGLERFRWRTVTALLMGSTGVVLVFSLPSLSLAGPLLAALSAVLVAIYLIFLQVSLRGVVPSVVAMWTSAGAALALTIASIANGQDLPARALGPAFALGVFSAFALVAFFEAIARIGSARSSIAAMLEPVTTVALATVLLGDDMNLRILFGAAMIVSVLPLLATTRYPKTSLAPVDAV